MAMKSKPIEMGNGGIEEWRAPDPEHLQNRADGRDVRISKTVRMRLRFSEMLRDESYRQSIEKGHRVSEADLIDEALQDFRIKHKLMAD